MLNRYFKKAILFLLIFTFNKQINSFDILKKIDIELEKIFDTIFQNKVVNEMYNPNHYLTAAALYLAYHFLDYSIKKYSIQKKYNNDYEKHLNDKKNVNYIINNKNDIKGLPSEILESMSLYINGTNESETKRLLAIYNNRKVKQSDILKLKSAIANIVCFFIPNEGSIFLLLYNFFAFKYIARNSSNKNAPSYIYSTIFKCYFFTNSLIHNMMDTVNNNRNIRRFYTCILAFSYLKILYDLKKLINQ